MRSILLMDTVQIEITNICPKNCANCTRFCDHVKKPYFMPLDQVKEAIDSMATYPKMTGIMGGEPLLHPDFAEICRYLREKIPPRRTGLWTCLPPGYEHYREDICNTFGHFFHNDHSRNDIYHHPFLVGAEDIVNIEPAFKWVMIDNCWAQLSWSASINPRGAFFCEIAASLEMLLQIDKGWKVEPGWWMRTPKDYKSQIETYCMKCGGAMPLKKRCSTSTKDEIGPTMYERIKNQSRKIKRGQYDISDCMPTNDSESIMAAYKDPEYRDRIAARYGIYTIENDMHFLTPCLSQFWKGGEETNGDQHARTPGQESGNEA